MPGTEGISQLLKKSAASGSRSTVLSPLGWLVAIEFAGLAGALRYAAPPWILQTLVGLIVVSVLLYMAAYVFFGHKSPDLLRTERFSLSKLAIEKSVRGDNLAGLLDPALEVDERLLPNVPASPKPGDKQ